ncbi:hypothetical protein [Streptomyces sp. NPDC003032]
MPNLPEDIVDRVKNLERQVRRLTTYVNTRAAAPAGTAGAATGESAGEGRRTDGGEEDEQTGQGEQGEQGGQA